MDKIKKLIKIIPSEVSTYKKIFFFLLSFVIRSFKLELILANISRTIGIATISTWPLVIISYFRYDSISIIDTKFPYLHFIVEYKLIFFPLIILFSFMTGEFFKYYAEKKEIIISAESALMIFKNLLASKKLSNEKIDALKDDDDNDKFISDILLARAIKCLIGTVNALIYLIAAFFIILYVKPILIIFLFLFFPFFIFFLNSYRLVVYIEDEFQRSRRKLRKKFTLSNLIIRNSFFKKRLSIQQKINSLTSFGFGSIISLIFVLIIFFYTNNTHINIKDIMLLLFCFQFLYFGIRSFFSNISSSLRYIPRVNRSGIINKLNV